MTAKWNVSGFPAAATGDYADDAFSRLIVGMESALSAHANASDPSTGAPSAWGSAEVGYRWLDTGVDGSAASPVLKRWQQLTASGPTYGWRTLRQRKILFADTPQAVVFTSTSPAAADVAAEDVDLTSLLDNGSLQDSGAKEAIVTEVLLQVNVKTGASETIGTSTPPHIFFLKKGTGQSFKVYPQVQNLPVEQQVWVGLDANEAMQFGVVVGGGTPAFEYTVNVVGLMEWI